MPDSSWSTEAANKLRKQRERKEQEDAALLEKIRLRQAKAPELWQELRNIVKGMCDSLNAEYGEEIVLVQMAHPRELNVRIKTPAAGVHELKATFESASSGDALKWVTAGHTRNLPQNGKYRLGIEDGKVFFHISQTPVTPEDIAVQMLDGLLLE
jgi:hypothetical protein